ncbi:MAG TPA: amidohydrolase family protein [Vicinamibacteria bacterium]
MRSLPLALVASAVASLAAAAPPEPIALVNASVVDVRTGRVSSGATVVLRGGRIESVAPGPAPAGVKVLDLRGRYLLPGLIDAHTHLATLRAARTALESGVTTARSSGTSSYADVGLRELARKGAIDGPDIVASGYHVRPNVAEEAFLGDPSLSDMMSGVDTVDEIRRMVRANLAHGVDFIKVLATERAGTADTDPRKQVYTEAELRALVEEAASKGVPVQAHAHGDEGARAAVRAGVRSIEHGTYLSDETLALMKERGTYFVPTYTTVLDLVEPGGDYDIPALHLRGQHMLPRIRHAVQRAHALGVKIVTGADTGYGPNSVTRISQEVVNLVELGLTPLEAVQAATVTAAELLRLEKTTGAVEAGLEADLVVVDGNPLQDPGVLRDPLLVVSNGRVAVNRLEMAKP